MKTIFKQITTLSFLSIMLISCETSYVDIPADDEVLDGTIEGLSNEELARFLKGDVALLGANIADHSGNLVYKGTTQNFNPLMAMACDLVIAEAEEIVETGKIPMENIHTQNIFIDFLVQ